MAREAPSADLSPLLRRAELFSNLLDDDLAYVEERCEELRLEAGAPLFGPGEKARRFFIVHSGEIGIFRSEEGGGEREIARYVAGDVLGDFDFAVGASFDARARAETAAVLIAFPSRGRGLEDLAREKPDTTARILLRSLSMISSRLRSTHRLISENAPWVRELRRQIYTDPGTGLWSRAFLDEELPRLIEAPTAIILLKPDRFKELNDAHGHSAGDEAMELVAGILVAEIGRLGRGWALRLRSNETALIVPRSSHEEARATALRLSAEVGRIEVPAAAGSGFRFTSSLSIALWPEDGAEWKGLVDDTYGVLTKAWRDGGNRIYRVRRRPRESGL
ncbi:MAG TPA: GGDEF domain-containing protein [Rectinemataceae bacterium]|nr:GGDEF domain-containing protein [Rectinemataceae bacterium]